MIRKINLVLLNCLSLILIVAFSIIISGCDENNNMVSMPEPTPLPTAPPNCLEASNNSSIIENNIECPTNALVQMCNRFLCNLEESNPDLPNPSFLPFTCATLSCFDFTCDISDFSDPLVIVGTGEFNIETVSGNQINGSVLIDNEATEEMGEFTYSCSPIVF